MLQHGALPLRGAGPSPRGPHSYLSGFLSRKPRLPEQDSGPRSPWVLLLQPLPAMTWASRVHREPQDPCRQRCRELDFTGESPPCLCHLGLRPLQTHDHGELSVAVLQAGGDSATLSTERLCSGCL